MIIYGAGLAGLVAANMLRRYNPVIREAQNSLPNNHAALLRFRTDAVSKVTGIPFKKVRVHKGIWDGEQLHGECNIALANKYSLKTNGGVLNRSIWNLDPVDRYIAPPNLIEQMADGLNIEYGKELTAANIGHEHDCISTVPMPIMMGIVSETKVPQFNFNTISSFTCDIVGAECDVYQTVYDVDRKTDRYRMSITGNHLIVEYVGDKTWWNIDVEGLLSGVLTKVFGINGVNPVNINVKAQKYGKLLPINEGFRKNFINQMTDDFGIYSLGRFATWRQLLMDDVVKDVYVIEKLIEAGEYGRRKFRSGAE